MTKLWKLLDEHSKQVLRSLMPAEWDPETEDWNWRVEGQLESQEELAQIMTWVDDYKHRGGDID